MNELTKYSTMTKSPELWPFSTGDNRHGQLWDGRPLRNITPRGKSSTCDQPSPFWVNSSHACSVNNVCFFIMSMFFLFLLYIYMTCLVTDSDILVGITFLFLVPT